MRTLDADSVRLNVHLPPRKEPRWAVLPWSVQGRFKHVSVMEGRLTPVIRPGELEDEKNPLVPTYRPGVQALPLSCWVSVGLLFLTSHLVRWLRQAL